VFYGAENCNEDGGSSYAVYGAGVNGCQTTESSLSAYAVISDDTPAYYLFQYYSDAACTNIIAGAIVDSIAGDNINGHNQYQCTSPGIGTENGAEAIMAFQVIVPQL
jgi:hypothetical protein